MKVVELLPNPNTETCTKTTSQNNDMKKKRINAVDRDTEAIGLKGEHIKLLKQIMKDGTHFSEVVFGERKKTVYTMGIKKDKALIEVTVKMSEINK